jgi:hypothetical protein
VEEIRREYGVEMGNVGEFTAEMIKRFI